MTENSNFNIDERPAADSWPASPPSHLSTRSGLNSSAPVLSGLILVLVSSLAVFFTGLGHTPLFNPDEALYAEPAREMLVTGEWTTTLLNYVVRYTKPPLCIWAMAFCYKLFGVNEFAARFFGVSCATVLVAIVYLTIARYISVRAAVIGALSLVLAPLFTLTAREAITDMPLALFMAGSQIAFFHSFKQRRLIYALAAYVFLGLAVMTKGPVGLVLPLGILFVYHLLRGELAAAFRFYRPLLGALIVSAIALPWFVVEINVTKGAYFQEFIIRENFQRFTAVVDNHKQPVWYHFLAMLGGYLPFSLYLPRIGAVWFGRLQSLCRAKSYFTGFFSQLKQALLAQGEAEDLCFYSVLWALAVLVFFSLSVSKLLPYTLPAFPAMAILVSSELESAFAAASFGRVCYPLLCALFLYACAGLAAPKLMQKAHSIPPGVSMLVVSYAAIQGAITLLAIVLGRLRHLVVGASIFALLSAGVFAVYLNLALPKVAAKLEGKLPDFAFFAGQSKDPVIVFDMRKPGVPFYAGRQVENVNGGDMLKNRLSLLSASYILTKIDKLDFLKTIAGTKIVHSEGDYALVRFVSQKKVEAR